MLSLINGSSSPNTEQERKGPKNEVIENSLPGTLVTKLGINCFCFHKMRRFITGIRVKYFSRNRVSRSIFKYLFRNQRAQRAIGTRY